MSKPEALSVAQCVAKRRRQLERLEFLLNATARRLCSADSSVPSRATCSLRSRPLYSEKAQTQTQRSYVQLLLDALRKEDEQLLGGFASALPLEDYAETMPRLLELRDEEDRVAQRTDLVWQVIRRRSAATNSTVEGNTTNAVLAQCELKWLSLVYGASYLTGTISKVQELHDATQCAKSPLAHQKSRVGTAAGSGGSGQHYVLLPKTMSSIRPVVVVNHRLAWASLAAKIAHKG